VSEATGRAALYLSVLSSSLVALGFASQSAHRFALFAATVFPAVVVLGLFTTARLVDTGVQNVAFLAGIARIRGYYRTLPAGGAGYFAPWGRPSQDELGQALASLSRTQSALTGLGTTAAMVAAVNSIVAGIGVALAVIRATGPGGTVVGAVFFGGFLAYQWCTRCTGRTGRPWRAWRRSPPEFTSSRRSSGTFADAAARPPGRVSGSGCAAWARALG
jgi:hypothetical protein